MPKITKRCVVLGGSFNPPTRAHKELLRAAIQKLDADLGLFVPSSDFYVTRKAGRQKRTALSEDVRKQLLLAMCDKDMSVDTCEYGDATKGRTLQTLQEIQAKYPDYEIWFLMGSDKLDIFHKWKTHEQIMKDFCLLWMDRDDMDCDALWNALKTDPVVGRYICRQNVLETPKSATGVSSSAFWETLRTDPVKAWGMIDENAVIHLKLALRDMLNTSLGVQKGNS